MSKIRVALFACLAVAAAAASADPGDLPINDWAKVDNGGQAEASRAEVKAQLREAQRLGLVSNGEEAFVFATPEQEQSIQAAGRRAAEQYAKSAEAEG